ncbi:hypothetical protein FRC03_003593 [Tulasnella sp. 419]|nr:hypothetical protein FRC03_003593 [Tulasnella sp. 419]
MTVEPNTQFSGAGPADFVMKLYDLLEDAALSDCLFWNPKGKSFTVRDVPRLSQSILPEHFDFLHCTSLVRQLKIYDFQLVKGYSAPTAQGSIMTWEFQHPKFRREHPQLLEEVRMLLAATTSDDSDQSDIALYDGLFDSKSTGRGLLPNFDPPMHRPHNHPLGPSSVGGLSAIRSRRHVTTSSSSDATDIRHRSQILGQLIPIPPPLLPELAAPTPWPVEGLNFGLGDEANRSTDAVTSGHVTPSSDGATDEARSSSSHSDFVHVLHRCLENKQHLEHLSWDPDGKSFTALFSASFKPTVLSTLFQDCSVLFFQEQLRAQGFKELNRTSKSETSDVKSIRFTHRKFRRGRPELLSQVRKGPTITMRARQVGPNENRSTVSSTAVGTDVSMTSTAVASSISSSSRVSAQRKKRSRSPDSE